MEQSEELAAVMRQMLADNAAAAEAVVAGARTEREKAAGERVAAHQALLDAQTNAETLAADFFNEHHARIEKDIRKSLTRDFADRLLRAGISVGETAALLDAPELLVAELARNIGYVQIKPADSEATIYAWAAFEDQGRGGYLTLRWGARTCRLWYEIAASPALTLLEIPRAEQWEAQTNIPQAQRQQALQFMGEQMLTRHTPGRQFRIEVDSIVIF